MALLINRLKAMLRNCLKHWKSSICQVMPIHVLLLVYVTILLTTDFSATKSMLESISTTVSELKQRPKTPFKQLV